MFFNDMYMKKAAVFTFSVCSRYRCRFFRTKTSNPGVGKRLKIFKEGNPELKGIEFDDEKFDDLDVDAMNTEPLKEEFDRKFVKIQKKVELSRIERKYFERRKNPNFLLWSEKEQIRQLHHAEPDRWTYEKLSECFPATPDVIKKITAAQWKLTSAAAIQKHDDHVVANWKAFQDKKIEVPPYLGQHLSKFVSRDVLKVQKEPCQSLMTPELEHHLVPTKSTEFISLIKDFKIKKPDEKELQPAEGVVPTRASETYVIGGRLTTAESSRRRHYTLAEMRELGVAPEETISDTCESTKNGEGLNAKVRKANLNPVDFASVPKRPFKEASNDLLMETLPREIPMKIFIPKEKWKKGAVYRVNNCFYADDGEFLYKI